jgi:molybdopterin/thiamine biosynthesis adenylyltransferase
MFRNYHGSRCDLLVYSMKYATQPPPSEESSPLHDIFLLDAPGRRSESEIQQLLSEISLQPGQLLTYLQPNLHDGTGSWIGVVSNGRQLLPLHALHLIGPGMLQFRRSVSTSASYGAQWSRLVGALGNDVFQRFRQREILLIGAGRTGSLLAAALVRMGLQRLTVVDPDLLESHNRDATVGNTARDCGRPKVRVLLGHLHRIRTAARLQGLVMPVQDARVLPAFRRCDAVFVCVDNDDARLHISHIAAQLLKVVLDCGTLVRRTTAVNANAPNSVAGSAAELLGDVRLILPGSCLACVGGLQPSSAALQQIGMTAPAMTAASPAGDISAGSELRQSTAAPSDSAPDWMQGERIGSLPSLNHLAVGSALQLWQELLAEQVTSSWWQRLHWAPGHGLRCESGPLAGRQGCPVCGGRGR